MTKKLEQLLDLPPSDEPLIEPEVEETPAPPVMEVPPFFNTS